MNKSTKSKERLNDAFNNHLKVIQRELIEGVLETLESNNDMYRKILINGFSIWCQSTGNRWENIWRQRNKLHLKMDLITRLENQIIEKYYETDRN